MLKIPAVPLTGTPVLSSQDSDGRHSDPDDGDDGDDDDYGGDDDDDDYPPPGVAPGLPAFVVRQGFVSWLPRIPPLSLSP